MQKAIESTDKHFKPQELRDYEKQFELVEKMQLKAARAEVKRLELNQAKIQRARRYQESLNAIQLKKEADKKTEAESNADQIQSESNN